MKKNYLKVIYALIAVSLANLIVMLCLIGNLPEQIPVHFNYRFEVDRMGTKWFMAVFPSIPVLFSIFMAVEQKIRGRDYANNKPLISRGAIPAGNIAGMNLDELSRHWNNSESEQLNIFDMLN